MYKFEPFSTKSCLVFLPAIYKGTASKDISIEGVLLESKIKGENGKEKNMNWDKNIALTIGHPLGVLNEIEEAIPIEEEGVVNMVKLEGWKMNWLYESILHKSEEGCTGGFENIGDPDPLWENIHTKAGQCHSLNACD